MQEMTMNEIEVVSGASWGGAITGALVGAPAGLGGMVVGAIIGSFF